MGTTDDISTLTSLLCRHNQVVRQLSGNNHEQKIAGTKEIKIIIIIKPGKYMTKSQKEREN